MLQQANVKPSLPVVWEKGVLSDRLGAQAIKKTSTDRFPINHATVRTHRLNQGHDAIVTVYYDSERQDGGYRRRLMASLNCYGEKGESVGFNGTVELDRLDDLVQTIRDIQSQLNSLKS